MTNTNTFRGFADYATNNPTSTTAAALLAAKAAASNGGRGGGRSTTTTNNNDTTTIIAAARQRTTKSLRPSPVYTGSDARIAILFRKIGRKSDPITRVRGLEELIHEVYPPPLPPPPPSSSSSSAATAAVALLTTSEGTTTKDEDEKVRYGGTTQSDTTTMTTTTTTTTSCNNYTRVEKIATLCHLAYLHEIRLMYDDEPNVRSTSYSAFVAARTHIPTAWDKLFLLQSASSSNNNNSDVNEGSCVSRILK